MNSAHKGERGVSLRTNFCVAAGENAVVRTKSGRHCWTKENFCVSPLHARLDKSLLQDPIHYYISPCKKTITEHEGVSGAPYYP